MTENPEGSFKTPVGAAETVKKSKLNTSCETGEKITVQKPN